MSGRSIKIYSTILFGAILLSVLALAGPLTGTADAEQVKVTDSDTLRIIDYEFGSRDIPEGRTAEMKVTLQNSSATTQSGDLEIQTTPTGVGRVNVAGLNPVTYTLQPGERATYIFELEAPTRGAVTREFVDISILVDGKIMDDPTPDTPNYPEEDTGGGDDVTIIDDDLSVFVLPRGSSTSDGTIEPTGERQTVTKAFSSFKDNGPGVLGSYDSSIPPVEFSDGEYSNTSQGRVFNFLSSTGENDQYTRIESAEDGNISVGVMSQNIPNTAEYTLQFRYQFITSTLDEAEVKIVSENGSEIDKDTKYMLNDTGTAETRYFQLSESESDWVRQNNNVYVTVNNTDLNTNNEALGVYYMQVLSSDNSLETSSSDIKVIDMTSSTTGIQPGKSYFMTYEVENTGSTFGTRSIPLYEDGELIERKEVTLNPQEQKQLVFEVSHTEEKTYTYRDLSSDGSIYVSTQGSGSSPPIASINETDSGVDSYYQDRLINDPTESTNVIVSASNSIAPGGSIVVYEWDPEWLDSTISTGSPDVNIPGPTTQGTYELTLTVENEDGKTDIASETLYAGSLTPNVSTQDDLSISSGDQVVLDATETTHPSPYRCVVKYRWVTDSGSVLASTNGSVNADGTCSEPNETVQHTFNNEGTYNITIQAIDDLGNIGTAEREVKVNAPEPTATVSADKAEALVNQSFTFDASNSYTDEGEITEYRWNAQGSTTVTETPTFDYSFTESGTYSVEVTIVNSFGGTDTASTTVNVLEQPFNVKIDGPTSGDTDTAFKFNNTPTEYRNNIDSWTWKMGDGTTYENRDSITHQFDSAGTYSVTLTGTTQDYGGFSDKDTLQVVVNTAPPVAVLNSSYAESDTVYISDSMVLDGSDSYDPDGTGLSYSWTVGNTEISNQPTIEGYEFNNLGKNRVTLTVTDQSGASDTAEKSFNIQSREPEASFTYSPQYPGPQEPTDFDATTTKHREPKGEIIEYRWNFSYTNQQVDATGQEIEFTFPANDEIYDVTLTVEDQWGQTDSITKQVQTDAYTSCHDFLRERPQTQSGYYNLDPLKTNDTIRVYCNMDYDGGGWTVINKSAFYEFSQQIGNTTDRGGDIRDWDVSPTDVYSYDGGGDHYFIYWIDTGFSFTEVRTEELTFGSAAYKAPRNDTSEVRGKNYAKGTWNDLNNSGASGDIAIGTKNYVFDSWSRHRGSDDWWQYTGASGVQLSYPKSGVQRFHYRDVTYQESASSVGVGWGESGPQWEGWEWEKGSFMVREPVTPPTYFYNQGDNIENFEDEPSLSTDNSATQFQSDQVELAAANKEHKRVIQSDNINLNNHDTIYMEYKFTIEEGGSGYIQIEAGGATKRDTIDQQYLVNDTSMELDVSQINSSDPITITVYSNNKDTIATGEVERVWGQGEGSDIGTNYSVDFSNGIDGWYAPQSSNSLRVSSGWARPYCRTYQGPTNILQKDLNENINAAQVSYSVQVSATDSWDSEALRFQIKDDTGWNTVEYTSNTTYWAYDNKAYGCQGGDYGEKVFTWNGTFEPTGSITSVRFSGDNNQDDHDEAIAINYVDITPSSYPTYGKRMPIEVTNPNSKDLVGNQVKVEVPYRSGMNSDFSDLRFSQSGQKLDYWVENKNNGSSATVWVETAKLNANSKNTIYAYYGKSGVNSQSNGDETFVMFDDFNRSSLGSDYTVRSQSGSGTAYISNGIAITEPMQRSNGSGYRTQLTYDAQKVEAPYEFHARHHNKPNGSDNQDLNSRTATHASGTSWSSGFIGYRNRYADGGNEYFTSSQTTVGQNATFDSRNWHESTIDIKSERITIRATRPGGPSTSRTFTGSNAVLNSQSAYPFAANGYSGYWGSSREYTDWWFISKYDKQEPTTEVKTSVNN